MAIVRNHLILLVSFLCTACTQQVLFSDFEDVSPTGWSKDEPVRFAFVVTEQDTAMSYDMLLHVRHTDAYPYQNLWFFVETDYPDALHRVDTLEFFLADERGRWLGRGRNGHIRMPILYEQQVHFADTGQVQVIVRQGMRTDLLRGVTQIGLEVRATN